MGRIVTAAVGAALVLALASPAAGANLADPVHQWLPSSDGASWTWDWSDSQYAPTTTRERYTLSERKGTLFRLTWSTDGLANPDGSVASQGLVDYRRTDAGLTNVNWASSPPPTEFPILCADSSSCGNSLAGTHYMLIWGSRSPVLSEPLLAGTRWSSLGGMDNDVASDNRYLGSETVVVPAFPTGVRAARIESDITQAGALGDPYGSGVRTVWWVYGVGPVRIEFLHAGGDVSRAELYETNLQPLPAPADTNYLPLNRGSTMRYRWSNSEHMRRASVQRFDVQQVVNGTALVAVKQLSGPIAVAGNYLLATRTDAVTSLAASTKSATRAKFPSLGHSRHFATPFDLMLYGFNPVLPIGAKTGQIWKASRASRDYHVFGVTGSSKVIGVSTVRTPAGRFRALVVRSTLKQSGHPFGSGTRTSWFAPGYGLVKLVFRHGDGSVSTVERLP